MGRDVGMRSPVVGVVWAAVGCATPAPRDAGPLPDAAFVWQHAWTAPVQEAVDGHDFDTLMVLAAAVSWTDGAPRVQPAAVGEIPPESTLVVRVEVPPVGADVVGVVSDIAADAWTRHPEASALQVDLDIPTARLGEYAGWLGALRPALGGRRLEATVLPTWLEADGVGDVLGAVDAAVLQVHWLDPDAPGRLLDPEALDHVEAAADHGRPFWVALPAYGYRVALDTDGTLAGVGAEQGAPIPPPGGVVQEVMADPDAVAAVVSQLRADRPEVVAGLAWFRLPTAQDRYAWAPQTLAAVRRGEAPRGRGELSWDTGDAGALTVTLRNTGAAPLSLPAVAAEGDILSADGLGPYTWAPGPQRFSPHPGASPLPPDAELVLGWLRPALEPADVSLHVRPHPH